VKIASFEASLAHGNLLYSCQHEISRSSDTEPTYWWWTCYKYNRKQYVLEIERWEGPTWTQT